MCGPLIRLAIPAMTKPSWSVKGNPIFSVVVLFHFRCCRMLGGSLNMCMSHAEVEDLLGGIKEGALSDSFGEGAADTSNAKFVGGKEPDPVGIGEEVGGKFNKLVEPDSFGKVVESVGEPDDGKADDGGAVVADDGGIIVADDGGTSVAEDGRDI
ncbi:hypothetical protein V6N11_022046 [Hibiscus sabdariffa]|uniref:Uncharacterized protein n=1 Tax=Hibiscus sabdariffa TaxID=183260 RepID=A0ABR2TI76_9ROSI